MVTLRGGLRRVSGQLKDLIGKTIPLVKTILIVKRRFSICTTNLHTAVHQEEEISN